MTKIKLKITLFAILMVFGTQVQAEENVLCIQKFLTKTVFNPGPSDGAWGKKTETAINQLMSQANNFEPQNIKKSDAENICKTLSGNQGSKLNEIGQFKRFPIVITEDIGEIKSLTDFDFTNSTISTNVTYKRCVFDIIHSEGWRRASGTVGINNGILVFKNHEWYAGLASSGREHLLNEEANLKLTNTGAHGILPHLSYVAEGEVDKPVQYLILGKDYIKPPPKCYSCSPSSLEEGILGSNNYTDDYGNTYTFKISSCS